MTDNFLDEIRRDIGESHAAPPPSPPWNSSAAPPDPPINVTRVRPAQPVSSSSVAAARPERTTHPVGMGISLVVLLALVVWMVSSYRGADSTVNLWPTASVAPASDAPIVLTSLADTIVRVRSEPNTLSEIIETIPAYGEVTVMCGTGGEQVEGPSAYNSTWYQIEYPAPGWISGAWLSTQPGIPDC